MMATELLRKEEEYRKINRELEEKSKYLLQEADHAMKQQETVYYSKIETYLKDKYNNRDDANLENLYDKDTSNTQIPANINDVGVKGMNHFFRAKIKKLQDDVKQLQNDIKIKSDECKRLINDNQKLKEEKDKWFQISTSNKSHVTKLENQLIYLNAKIQSKENENLKLKKEIEEVHKQLKILNSANGITETKLLKGAGEREKLKETIQSLKREEKLLKESHTKQIDEMSTIIKRIDKHRNELVNGFKKQLQLLDNLKRQKALMENIKVTEKLEKDFLKILDWNLDEYPQ